VCVHVLFVRARARECALCMYFCAHTYKHTYTLTHTKTHIRACVRAHTHTQTRTQSHTQTHTRKHTHTHTHMITSSAPPGRKGCSNTHVVCMRAHVHMSAHRYHTCPLCISRTYRHVHRCARACICTHACTHAYARLHVYTD